MKEFITNYPDGTSYATIKESAEHISRTVRINSYDDLWKLGQFIRAFHNETGRKPHITIPNLIDAQADNRFATNQSYGLLEVIKFLAELPASYTFFHPHNEAVVRMGFEILGTKIGIRDNSTFVYSALKHANVYDRVENGKRIDHNTVLMSADAGGYKSLMKVAERLHWKGDTYSATKSREYKDGKSILTQCVDRETFGGKDVFIIDDICVYGGTFKGLANILRQSNVGKLYLVVSHMTIQNHKGDDTVFKYFDHVYTTNSKFNDYYVEDKHGEPIKPENLSIIQTFYYDA